VPEGGKLGVRIRLKFLGMLGLLSAFRDRKETDIDFNGGTVGDLVHHLVSQIRSDEKQLLIDEQEEISPELLVFLNGNLLAGPSPFSQPLEEGDLVELALPPG
jgi:hypothetical protein